MVKMDREAELRYWKARAAALEETLRQMRQRSVLLAEEVPLEMLKFVDGDLEKLLEGQFAASLLDDSEDPTALSRADVASELALVWRRCGPGEAE